MLMSEHSHIFGPLPDSAGASAFPDARYNGGSIAGIPVLVSDQVTAGEVYLVDASAVDHRDEQEIQDILAMVRARQEEWKAEARAEYSAKRSYLGAPVH